MRRPLLAVALVLVAGAAACGGGGETAGTTDKPRDIEVLMRDSDFSLPVIGVHAKETVRFTFRNVGALPHEAFVGNEQAQQLRGNADGSTEPAGGVYVKPGETGTLVYTFGGANTLVLGCHVPGHYEAGMKARITVS